MSKNLFLLFMFTCLALQAVTGGSNLRRAAVQSGSNDIIPILECIDKNNRAYFTFQNNGGATVNLAKSDQNRLSPLDIAPITNFVNGSGPSFPYSTQVSLAGFENSTFSWELSNYILSFTITPELACPTTFNITMNFKYEIEGALGFLTIPTILTTFADVAGISFDRLVEISYFDNGPTAKRATLVDTADLILEIQLADGNSTNLTDPTAAEVVNQFVNNQKTEELNQELQTQFSPKFSNLTEFTPKTDSTASIYGQVKPPTNAPIAEPSADVVPKSAPVASPKAKTNVSLASIFTINPIHILCFTLLSTYLAI